MLVHVFLACSFLIHLWSFHNFSLRIFTYDRCSSVHHAHHVCDSVGRGWFFCSFKDLKAGQKFWLEGLFCRITKVNVDSSDLSCSFRSAVVNWTLWFNPKDCVRPENPFPSASFYRGRRLNSWQHKHDIISNLALKLNFCWCFLRSLKVTGTQREDQRLLPAGLHPSIHQSLGPGVCSLQNIHAVQFLTDQKPQSSTLSCGGTRNHVL